MYKVSATPTHSYTEKLVIDPRIERLVLIAEVASTNFSIDLFKDYVYEG